MRIAITGGTGFVGRWLLESLLAANAALDLRARVVVLTRSPERVRTASPPRLRRLASSRRSLAGSTPLRFWSARLE